MAVLLPLLAERVGTVQEFQCLLGLITCFEEFGKLTVRVAELPKRLALASIWGPRS
jgi:hypothetical protein